MRDFDHYQLSLMTQAWAEHPHAEELKEIGEILDSEPELVNLVAQDLDRGIRFPLRGARGLGPSLVLRAVIIKQLHGFSYNELSFHLSDSVSFRAFCGIDPGQKGPKRAALQKNIKRLRPETLAAISASVVGRACTDGVEDFDQVRYDSTVVDSAILYPTDSGLLWDCVRVLTRSLERAQEAAPGLNLVFSDHRRRAKRRNLNIQYAKSKKDRVPLYRDLLKVTRKAVSYAEVAVDRIENAGGDEFADVVAMVMAKGHAAKMVHTLELARRVIDQTERRIFEGESVPAKEKIVSIFEEHTDVIVKDARETQFGHKVFLSSGKSGLILDSVIEDGNPADSELALPLVNRNKELYDVFPRQVAFDGGFASKQNLSDIKNIGVEDVAFNKKRGLDTLDMARSPYVYKKLTKFRAGIEAGISFLKRVFGLGRCTWRSLQSFKSYILASVVSCNLLTLARHRIAGKPAALAA